MNSFWTKALAWARTAPGRYRKAIAALWGYLTVPVLVGIAALAGWHLDGGTAALIITIGSAVLGTGAVAAVKPNDNVRPAPVGSDGVPANTTVPPKE